MNHSIATADRTTHLKIVVVALIGATLVAGVGIAARVTHVGSSTAASQLKFYLDHTTRADQGPLKSLYDNRIKILANS